VNSSEQQPQYQHMTALPEDLERALLKVPATSMIKKIPKLLGVSAKYTLVQKLAKVMDESELRKFVAQDHAGETDDLMLPTDAPVERAPRVLAPAGERAPIVKVFDATVIELAAGKTTIQPGSLRESVLSMLKAKGGKMPLGDISAALGRDAKPIVAKLRAAGWVK
jgi:hypothetical protein